MKNDPLMLEAFGPCLPTLKVKLFLCGTETKKILLWIMCDAVSGHVKSLSRSVIKNLTLSRVKKIILFFLYSTWGVHFVEMGQKNYFLQRTGLKTLISAATVLDRPIWGKCVCIVLDHFHRESMGNQWSWPFELFHWIFCLISHCLW